jgi:hypothetical protein
MRQGDVAAAWVALGAAKDAATGLSEREASHTGFFDLVFAGRTDAAIAAVDAHLTAWPRGALVVASAANPNGLIGGSGRIGQKHQIAALMDSLAPHYGADFWFLVYHAMALSEDGQLAVARAKIERSVAANPSPVRMRISSRSNSARPPNTVSIKRPCAVVVSAHASPSVGNRLSCR